MASIFKTFEETMKRLRAKPKVSMLGRPTFLSTGVSSVEIVDEKHRYLVLITKTGPLLLDKSEREPEKKRMTPESFGQHPPRENS